MKGMNQKDGHAVTDLAHLYQSVAIILTTPEGTRIARREFGCPLFALVDAPHNRATQIRVFSAVATALMRWEPRLKVTRIGMTTDPARPGVQVIEIEGTTNLSRDLVSTSVALTRNTTP